MYRGGNPYLNAVARGINFRAAPARNKPRAGRIVFAARTKRRGVVQNGYQRTGGNYGRYSGSGAATSRYHQEKKFLDVSITRNDISQGTWLSCSDPSGGNDNLLQIAQGTTESQRIGRYAYIRGIQLRYTAAFQGSDIAHLGANNHIRIVVVLDKQTNGAAMTGLDVMLTSSIRSWRNLENSQRFDILMDRTHIFHNGVVVDAATDEVAYDCIDGKFYKPCSIKIEYSGLLGAITEEKSNSIHCFAFVEGTDGVVDLLMTWRFRFTDG